MTPAIRNRGLFILVHELLAHAVARSQRSEAALATALGDAERDRVDVVRLTELAEQMARLVEDDDTIKMLRAVARANTRDAAAQKAA